MAQRKNKKQQPLDFQQKIIRYGWLFLASIILIGFALFALVSLSKMPDTAELENPKYEYSSIVYSVEGKELGRYFRKNREWVSYEDLSPFVVNALIATEDNRFFRHSGIDARGTLRALAYLGRKGGASTITQQLAKLFFTRRSRNVFKRVWQKLQEWIIAIEFEKRYTKEEIISMYLNKYDFLYDSHGIGAAARTYFGKDHNKLELHEAATLVGMLKNPSLFNPRTKKDNALKRREVVLKQMVRYGYLEQERYDSLRVLPIDLSSFNRQSHDKGPAPYFREELKKWLQEKLNSDEFSKRGGGKYDIYQDGLRIFTTINLNMQRHAEEAMKTHMSAMQVRYFKRWKNLDPWSYKATAAQKQIRLNSLRRNIESSDRYKSLRARFLSNISSDISKNISGVRLWDADIERMIEEYENPGYLNKLLRRDFISKKQKNTYSKILESEYWNDLLLHWNDLQNTAKEAFAKKTRMRVFAYNSAGEKDTIMSPLDSIKYHRMHLQLGSIAIEPQNGHIKTWVGGVGFKYFKFDHINSNRQVGSTFKPVVYTTAIMQGRSPCWKIQDTQYSIAAGDPDFGLLESWEPKNSSGFSNEYYTLYDCLKLSLNSASVWLMKQIGSSEAVRDVAGNLGINKSKIPNAPSICLGSADLSVMDMTQAYAVFANNGIHTTPVFVTRIEDNEGNLIWRAIPKQRKALPTNYNYVMVDMLKYAASTVHWKLESEFGGKTGTTDDHVDGWFMGITPNLVTGTWVGGEAPWIRFLTLADGQGGVMARPYFLEFMKRIESDQELSFDTKATFSYPEEELGIEIDCEKYEQLYQNNTDEFEEEPSEFDEFEESIN